MRKPSVVINASSNGAGGVVGHNCWECRQAGYIRMHCPQLRRVENGQRSDGG